MDRSSDSHIACDSAQTNNALEDNNPPPSDEHPSSSSMSPDSKPPTEEKQSVVFKVPFTNPALKLVKQVKGVSLPDTRTDTGVKCDVEDKINKEENTGAEHPNLKKSPLEAPEVSSSSVPYKVPEWSGLPSKPYSFEVLKGGVILETIFLSSRPFTVCGRHSSCDVVMEHPSISRYHAIIQYRAEADDNKTVGFYLFDLESTHGTQLNKCPVRPNSYYRVHVGHMIKFGGSSRTYILQGPPEDSEEESELTVTEIKERRKQEEEHQLRLQEQANAKRDKEDEDEGIDWGMGDDATEEDSYGENPYALNTPSLNEELYIEDPKKTLRGWFEREGYDLEYAVEEKGPAHFLCRVELPLDTPSGGPMYAEASVKGKKKEAVIACALEACRILDRHGVLRRANPESRKRKKRNWEENDFYDSDEDTYLDQTGTIEKKRLQRIQRLGKDSGKAETYESLLEKYNKVLNEIEDIENMLKKQRDQATLQDTEDVDSLDAYMLAIKNKNNLDKKEITRLKIHLSQLKSEERKLQKLVNIAKPAILPSTATSSYSKTPTKPEQPTTQNLCRKVESPSNLESCGDTNKIEESSMQPGINSKYDIQSPTLTEKVDFAAEECKNDGNQEVEHNNDNVQNQDCITDIEKRSPNNESREKGTMGALEAVMKRDVNNDLKKNRKLKQKKYDYDSSDPNYAMWLPPDDQSGDGRTKLNEKYGY